jgi:cytoskeletal protein CcmA (bactofilin family)
MSKNNKYDRGSSGVHSIVGEGSVFEGNIEVEGSLRIDGQFTGTVKCDAFYVGRSAEVTAEIQANRSVVGGKIKGNLVSPMEVVVEETATIIGDVKTDSLQVAEKAVIHGVVDMGKADVYEQRLAALKKDGKEPRDKPDKESEKQPAKQPEKQPVKNDKK